jgi:hypothetical protein
MSAESTPTRFAVVPSRWAGDPTISTTDKAVLLALAIFANGERYCWPSMASLAARVGIDARNVRAAIGRLKQRGAIEVVERFEPVGDGDDIKHRQTSNGYYILGYDWIEPDQTTKHPRGGVLASDHHRIPASDAPRTPVSYKQDQLEQDHLEQTHNTARTRESVKSQPVPKPLIFADHPLAAAALDHFRHASRQPNTLDATLIGLLSGLGAPNGKPVPRARLAQALADMHLNGHALSPAMLRSYLDRLRREDEQPATAAGPKGDGLSWKERERLRQKAIWDAHMIEMERLDAIDAAKAAAARMNY